MEQEEKKENLVAVLLVEEGNKPGQPIATYCPSRRVHHLVFMPREVPVGQQVRVKLVETGKEDSRGRMLYRAVPAPAEYAERWRDNNDGTASLVLYSTSWLLSESEEGEREKRPLAVDVPRPEEAVTRTNHLIDWGKDSSDTTIVETEVLVTPLYKEYLWSGYRLEWEKTGYQEVPGDMDIYPLAKIDGAEQSLSREQMLSVVWENDWQINLKAYFMKDGQKNNITDQKEWGKLPVFVQQQLQSEWPLCLCGRERISLAPGYKLDDYPKCNQCRSEEHCERCGEQKPINYLAGHLVCNECKPYESAEQLIDQSVSAERKQALADLVKKLLTAQPLEAELGILVLKNNLSHISNTRAQGRILDQWKGYQWYYSAADGTYGTKFSASALAILQYLPQASGNGLVEMITWLTDNLKAANDFYTRTQMRGEKISLPDLQIRCTITQIMSENFGRLVADKLSGSEADRSLALEGREKLAILSAQSDDVRNLLREVDDLLQASEQDYAKVINKISDAETFLQNLQRLEDLLVAEYSVCPICGGELNRNVSHYCGQDYEVELGCLEDGEPLKESFGDNREEVLVSLVFNAEYQEIKMQINQDVLHNLGAEKIVTETTWNAPTEAEKSLRVRMNELKKKLMAIERERNISNRIAVSFAEGLDPKGEKQMQAEGVFSGVIDNKKSDNGYSEYSNQNVVFVANIHSSSWLDETPQPRQVWSCKPAFQISTKDGKPVIVVNPQLRLDQETEIRAQIEALQKEENNLAPEATVDDIAALKAAWGLQ